MFELIKKKIRHLQGYGVPLVQYFYISAQEEDDAGTAGVLSGGDYTSGMFWAWALGLGTYGPGVLGAWGLGLLPWVLWQ